VAVLESSAWPGERLPNPHRRRHNRRLMSLIVGWWCGFAFFITVMAVFLQYGPLPQNDRGGGLRLLWIAGAAVVSLAGGVLVGVGMSRVARGIHRHFRPEEPKE
jgi:hypothetical protein